MRDQCILVNRSASFFLFDHYVVYRFGIKEKSLKFQRIIRISFFLSNQQRFTLGIYVQNSRKYIHNELFFVFFFRFVCRRIYQLLYHVHSKISKCINILNFVKNTLMTKSFGLEKTINDLFFYLF